MLRDEKTRNPGRNDLHRRRRRGCPDLLAAVRPGTRSPRLSSITMLLFGLFVCVEFFDTLRDVREHVFQVLCLVFQSAPLLFSCRHRAVGVTALSRNTPVGPCPPGYSRYVEPSSSARPEPRPRAPSAASAAIPATGTTASGNRVGIAGSWVAGTVAGRSPCHCPRPRWSCSISSWHFNHLLVFACRYALSCSVHSYRLPRGRPPAAALGHRHSSIRAKSNVFDTRFSQTGIADVFITTGLIARRVPTGGEGGSKCAKRLVIRALRHAGSSTMVRPEVASTLLRTVCE